MKAGGKSKTGITAWRDDYVLDTGYITSIGLMTAADSFSRHPQMDRPLGHPISWVSWSAGQSASIPRAIRCRQQPIGRWRMLHRPMGAVREELSHVLDVLLFYLRLNYSFERFGKMRRAKMKQNFCRDSSGDTILFLASSSWTEYAKPDRAVDTVTSANKLQSNSSQLWRGSQESVQGGTNKKECGRKSRRAKAVTSQHRPDLLLTSVFSAF